MSSRKNDPIQRVTACFRPWPHVYYYAGPKMRWDPAYPECVRLLHESSLPLLDVGCGAGLLAGYLAAHGCEFPIHGVEPDEGKIQIANQALPPEFPQLRFSVGDARELPEFSGNVVMLDVIHYFQDSMQKQVLRELARRVAPGGLLLQRFCVRDGSWRYWATQMEEMFVRTSRWIVGGDWNFPTAEAVVQPLEEAGLTCELHPMWGRTPFNSHLLVARRSD